MCGSGPEWEPRPVRKRLCIMISFFRPLAWVAALVVSLQPVFAWDYEGHRIVNRLALAGLPADFPAFVREPAAAERIAFLAGEPDRWRNDSDLPIKHYNGLDHYLDLEQLAYAGLDADTVSPLRYEFAAAFAAGRAAHPERFPAIDPTKNTDHSREWCGFLPWSITEYYGKLRSAFSYLQTFRVAGTPAEVADAGANVVYLMGVMGHYVGDGAQPLHLSVHHNGWVGDNPHGYTTSSKFHGFIDGGFIAKAGITYDSLASRARPAGSLFEAGAVSPRDPMFDAVMRYLKAQNERVEPLYRLEKAHKFDTEPPADSSEGRAFIEEQLLRGGEMLASVWVTAWKNAALDPYLRAQLEKRAAGSTPAPTTTAVK